MHCPTCQRTWPDEFKVCPLCAVPLKAEMEEEASGAIAQGPGAVAAGEDGLAVGGHVIIAAEGATVVIGEPPVEVPAVDRESALGRYLRHVISRNRYLQLQGIRSGGKLVHVELEQIYVTLRATRQRTIEAEEAWLEAEARLAPGEAHLCHPEVPRVSLPKGRANAPLWSRAFFEEVQTWNRSPSQRAWWRSWPRTWPKGARRRPGRPERR